MPEASPAQQSLSARPRIPPVGLLVSVGLALTVLGPVLIGGFVLDADMVFVPDQPWRAEWLGLGSSLPRAVPVDAVVSLATTFLPGAVLQKVVLLACIVLAGWGAARLVPSRGRLPQTAAAVTYVWNPYVAERLLLGQWTVLVAHAALPWVFSGAMAVRAGSPGGLPRTLLPTAAASLTATGGVLGAAVAVAGAGLTRRGAPLLLGLAALQLPWLVPALLSPGGAGSDPAGVAAFAARAENWSGTLGSLLALGGVWNAQAVPGSRGSVLAPLLTLALLVLVAFGLPVLVRRWGRAAVLRLAAVAGCGLLLASAGAFPVTGDLLRLAVEGVPGAGLLRDGHKWLAPLALFYALSAALAVERLAAVPARRVLAVLAVSLPLASLPDLAWGIGGRWETVRYPDDWAVVRSLLQADDHPGAVVSLPFQAYRAYEWNGGRRSLDPAPRWFDEQVVANDRLLVDGVLLRGEDPRSAQVGRALGAGRPLSELGVGWVLVQHGTPGEVPGSATRGASVVHVGRDLSLYRLPGVSPVDLPSPPAFPVVLGDVVALAIVASAAGAVLARRVRRSYAAGRRDPH